MLKKFITFLAVCAMSFMIAVPAFAEDVKFTFTDETGHTFDLTFSNAVLAKTPVPMADYDWGEDVYSGTEDQELNLITVTQDSKIIFDETEFFGVYCYDYSSEYNGYVINPGSWTEIGPGTVQENMPNFLQWRSVANSNGEYLFSLPIINGEEYYLLVKTDGAASTAATTPAPETTATATETATPAPATTTQAVETKTPAAAGDAVAYTVQKWDTLGHISLNYYGSYKYHQAIYAANKEAFRQSKGQLKPGMVIYLPTTIAEGVNIMAQPVAGEGEKLYTVKAGDTLGTIAAKYYGSTAKYKAIFERNKDRIKNVNMIYEGQIIVLPAK